MIYILFIILFFNIISLIYKIHKLETQIDFLINSQNTDDFWKEADQ